MHSQARGTIRIQLLGSKSRIICEDVHSCISASSAWYGLPQDHWWQSGLCDCLWVQDVLQMVFGSIKVWASIRFFRKLLHVRSKSSSCWTTASTSHIKWIEKIWPTEIIEYAWSPGDEAAVISNWLMSFEKEINETNNSILGLQNNFWVTLWSVWPEIGANERDKVGSLTVRKWLITISEPRWIANQTCGIVTITSHAAKWSTTMPVQERVQASKIFSTWCCSRSMWSHKFSHWKGRTGMTETLYSTALVWFQHGVPYSARWRTVCLC